MEVSAVEALVDRYCLGWSAPTSAERERLIRQTLTDDATYCDPRADHLGVDELLAHIERIVQARPGVQVLRTSRVDVHHDVARFSWHLRLPDGSALPEGIDCIVLSTDGQRIRWITGFFGPLKPISRATSRFPLA